MSSELIYSDATNLSAVPSIDGPPPPSVLHNDCRTRQLGAQLNRLDVLMGAQPGTYASS